MTPLARWILRRALPPDVRDAVVADLDAEFARARRSTTWYWGQALRSLPPAVWMRCRRLGIDLPSLARDAGQDMHFAVRMLTREKTFAAASIATLALGVGVNTAIYSVVDRAIVRPLPFKDPARLVRLWSSNPRGLARGAVAPADFFDWRDQARGFESLAAFAGSDITLTGAGEPVQISCAQATANLAATFGVAPIAGRWFTAAETAGDGQHVVVLSEPLWRTRFGAAADIVGRPVTLDGRARTIVGVMPAGFRIAGAEQLWQPLPDNWRAQPRNARFLGVMGRLAPGSGAAPALDDLRAIAARIEAADPANRGWGVTMVPLADAVFGEVRRPLLVLFGATAAILLIACANVAGLMFARGASRSREFAVRAAIGASRGRLLRQQLVEATAVAALGGLAGLSIAAWSIQAIKRMPAAAVPFLDSVALDTPVLAAAAVMTLLTMIACSVVPAWHAARRPVSGALGAGERLTKSHVRIRRLIVVGQIAFATALVAGGLLLVRSLARLTAVPSGFAADRTLLADVSLPATRYKAQARAPFFDGVLDRIRALPGVQAAGAGGPLPLSGQEGMLRFGATHDRWRAQDEAPRTYVRWATPGYFAAMGIAQRAGRGFAASDTEKSAPVAVIDDELARRLFGSDNPVGRRIQLSMQRGVWREVVGVVGAVHQTSLDRGFDAHVYLPETQLANWGLTIVVRSARDPRDLARDVRAIVGSVDASLPLANIRSLADLVDESVGPRRLNAQLLSAFAICALLLTAVGVYSVMSQIVTQSTKELGIRLALGASAAGIVGLTVKRAAAMTLAGVVLGSVLAWVMAPALRGLVYGIAPRDPLTLLAAVALSLAAAMVAAYLPSRRLLRLDVAQSLRD